MTCSPTESEVSYLAMLRFSGQDELQDASRVEGEAANHIPIGLRGSCYGNVDHVEHSIHTCVHASCTARAKQ